LGHRVSRPRGTASVGDSVGEGNGKTERSNNGRRHTHTHSGAQTLWRKDDCTCSDVRMNAESPSDSSAQAFSAAPSRVVEKTLEEAPADSTASASASEGAGAEGAGAETEEKKKKKSSIKSFFGFKKKDKGEKEEKDKASSRQHAKP
jgi:hypothetical protein